jgi:multidrug efflux pump subunit AcrA (membrane-fusion protein)
MTAQTAVEASRSKKRWIVVGSIAVLVVVGGIVISLILGSRTSATPVVASAAVTTKTLTVLVSADGTTKASNSTSVYPAVSGTVEHLYVALGDTVQAGDRLYTLDGASLQAALVQADASLAQARQSVRQSRQTLAQANQSHAQASQSQVQAALQRVQADQSLAALKGQPASTPGLADQIVVATKQRDSAIAAEKSARAAVITANASVATAKAGITTALAGLRSSEIAHDQAVKNRNSTTVEAPVSGVVTALPFDTGGTVSAASAGGASGAQSSGVAGLSTGSTGSGAGGQLVISDNAIVKARVQVNENDLAKVKIGQDAVVTVDAAPGLTLTGKVSWISPNGVSTSGVVTYDVDIELVDQSARVHPDMTATAEITAAVLEDALVVPSSAIRVDGTRKYVDVVAADGTTTRSYIVTGSTDASSTQVTGGVTSGQRVVTGPAAVATSAAGVFPRGN